MSNSVLIAAPAAHIEVATLFVGFELGKATWLIGLYAPELGKTISRIKSPAAISAPPWSGSQRRSGVLRRRANRFA
jgi:hypothetical protein